MQYVKQNNSRKANSNFKGILKISTQQLQTCIKIINNGKMSFLLIWNKIVEGNGHFKIKVIIVYQ